MDDLLVVTAADVEALLAEEERAVLDIVGAAYGTHASGESVLPHSCFLRFPESPNRIIALPAYLGGGFQVAGLKWIASFPANVARGEARASGVVVLNCLASGRPRAIVDGGVVSAQRTAASAAVAARALHGESAPACLGLVGCGAINGETLRFLRVVWPRLARVVVADLDPQRTEALATRARRSYAGMVVDVVREWRDVVASASVVSFATTAMAPYVESLHATARTVLHLSLRDLAAPVVLAADNVVDDADHVCRAETSLHLAERAVGDRRFIRASLADVLAGRAVSKRSDDSCTIFSPFGLGILDIAVANFVCERAEARGKGTRIPWATRAR